MRSVVSRWVGWILSIVLMVASMPLRASEMPCVATAPVAIKAGCGMPCCATKHAAATMACMVAAASHAVVKPPAPCGCEMKSAPHTPIAAVGAALPTVQAEILATLPPTAIPGLPTALGVGEPGILGGDSGPPPRVGRPVDRGRAPPVA